LQIKFHQDEEKNSHRVVNRLCFRHYHDLMQVKFDLSGLWRIVKVRQGNTLLIKVLGHQAMNARLRPMVRLLLTALFGAWVFSLSAQEINIGSDSDKPVDERIIYNRLNTFNIAIHSQGFGAGFTIGKIRSIHKTTYWKTEIISLHSTKEIKTINLLAFSTRPFIYGKLNSVYALRFGYGAQRRIFGKPYWGGVETRWNYEAGATLALLKPYYYYVVVYKPYGANDFIEVEEEQTFDNHDQWITILGKSAFTKGIAETKLSPGIHASIGLSFDFAKSRTKARALNVDVIAEYYPLGVRIMDQQRNPWFYLTFMLSYHWGSVFNK